MLALLTAVLAASLLGGVHCAGMCGAFLAFAVAGPDEPRPRMWTCHSAYHLGRLATYMLFGVVAGSIGATLDMAAATIGLSRLAAALAGVTMSTIGVCMLMRHHGIRVPRMPVPGLLSTALCGAHRRVGGFSPVARAGAIGLLTTLLPCGWLYAFVIVAAGTANPWGGAAVMAVFWMGTLPVMMALGLGLQVLTGPFRRRLPVVTSVALVIVGCLAAAGRIALPGDRFLAELRGLEAVSPLATTRVQSIDTSRMPCCNGPEAAP